MGETYQSTRARLGRMLRQKKMKEREKAKSAASQEGGLSQTFLTQEPASCGKTTLKRQENPPKRKGGVDEKKVVEQLVNFIEGVEMKERNEKRAAKKARQREKKRQEEEERARLLAVEEERKRREEALRLALQRKAELELIEASKMNKKKKGKKSRGPPTNNHHPGNTLSANNSKSQKPMTGAVGGGGGNIVTIRRLVEQPSSKTFVTTVTLKGKSSTDDKVLYKFYSQDNRRPVLNYQTVDSEQYDKKTQAKIEASQPKTNFPSVIIGRNDANTFVPLKVNNAVNNTPSKASPKAFNIKDIKLPPCITITVKSNSAVENNSSKEIERENAVPTKKSRRRRKAKTVVV